MPRYYLDLHSGSQYVKDTRGFKANDDDDAQVQAIKLLSTLVRDCDGSADHLSYVASVRDIRGVTLYHIDLSLDFSWPE